MKQIAVTSLAAYLDDEITAMPNLVSVGALNTGSITSGFTSIDVGAGAITTTGTGTIGNLVVDNFTLNGTELDLSSGDFTLDVAGDIILDADGGEILFHDNTTAMGHVSMASSNITIKSLVSDKDIIFQGNDGGSAITALTLDMSAAGAASFNSTITATGSVTASGVVIANDGTIGSTGGNAMNIGSGGVVTFAQAPVFPDGSLAIADLDIDGGTDIGADLADADLFIVDDGAGGTNRKVTASRLPTYIKAHLTSNSSIESGMLNNNVISGQTALTSGLALDDEIFVSDGGVLKRMDISVLTAITDDNATALAIALG
jgi:hypothetical protein